MNPRQPQCAYTLPPQCGLAYDCKTATSRKEHPSMEFVCSDPNAMVRAANVKATLDAFNLVPKLGQKIIESHQLKIDDLRPENMVPVQRWLDALKEIQQKVGIAVIQKVGRGIIVNAQFPPHFDSVEKVLEALDSIYQMNHKGDVGHYRFERTSNAVVMHCETPYPRAFELGLIEGISENPRLAKDKRYFVMCEDAPPGGVRTCSITVRPMLTATSTKQT